ncbi:hypothetical protein HNP84_000019 [Thermocatellispora tengchongensis]|uniref:Uncharacterized protein n=1 Tax=Thermocatellispora tengchongensis TaxID=1073253 RepID=A0A840NXD5_9ACTN|nr:hypothetical protein [Thermocatellispora tengchongensis]MBB5130331.1 hypothetical protein [Thermocatellispora tengchongensis]
MHPPQQHQPQQYDPRPQPYYDPRARQQYQQRQYPQQPRYQPQQHQQQPQQPYVEVTAPRGGEPAAPSGPPRRRRGGSGKMIAIAAGAVVAVAAGVGAFLVLSGGDEPQADRKPSVVDKSYDPNDIPSPTAEETRQLLAGLTEIDPALNHHRSIGKARDTCWNLLLQEDRDRVLVKIQQRFGQTADINKTEAGRIMTLIEGTFCRK